MKYQSVVWHGESYVMTPMGFSLGIAPKFMSIIAQWITYSLSAINNYNDKLKVIRAYCADILSLLSYFGQPTNPAKSFAESQVCGLQLSHDNDAKQTGHMAPVQQLKYEATVCDYQVSHLPVVQLSDWSCTCVRMVVLCMHHADALS